MFGMSYCPDGDLWVVQNKGHHLHRTRIDGDEMSGLDYVADFRCVDTFFRRGFHQIDFIDEELFLCDTYNNRILVAKNIDNELKIHRVVYPMGRHKISTNMRGHVYYRHFNSVYRHGDIIYLAAHNDTGNTDRNSQIHLLERYTLNTVGVLDDVGKAIHNIVVDFTGKMYVCDSLAHTLVVYDGVGVVEVWKDEEFKTFLRGLAINDDFTVIGGSIRVDTHKEYEHSHNDKVPGYVFILDKKKKKVLCTYKFENCGQIHDIRLRGLDYGLSNTWRKPK
jgi:hypothetical protein